LENSINLLTDSWKVIGCLPRITLLHGLAVFIVSKSYEGRQVRLQSLDISSAKS